MITTELDRDKVIGALNQGAEGYVIKPFTQEYLIGKIMESLGMEK
jgi:DNA-binding response OmpR family regulator